MTESSGQNSAQDDSWFMEVCREVEQEQTLDPDCATLSHQALKDMYQEIDRSVLVLDTIDRSSTINVFTYAGRMAIRLLAVADQGALVINERSKLMLMRGSILYDPSQPPTDKFGKAIVHKLFQKENIPANFKISPHQSMPILAAKGQLVVGGYVAMSPAYTENQMRDAMHEGEFDSELFLEKEALTVLGKKQQIYWLDKTTHVPGAITKIMP
jgi:hypothetical protein